MTQMFLFVTAVQHERAPRSCQKRPIFGSDMPPVTGFPSSVGIMTSHGMNLPPLPHYYSSLFPPSPFKPSALHPFLPTSPPIAPLTLTLSHNSAFKPNTSNTNSFSNFSNINSISNLINNSSNNISGTNGLNINNFSPLDISQSGGLNFKSRGVSGASISTVPYSISSSTPSSISLSTPSSIQLTPPADTKTSINGNSPLDQSASFIGSLSYLKSTNNRYGDVTTLPEASRPISERLGFTLPQNDRSHLTVSTNGSSAFSPLRRSSPSTGEGDEEVSSSLSSKQPPPPQSPTSTSSESCLSVSQPPSPIPKPKQETPPLPEKNSRAVLEPTTSEAKTSHLIKGRSFGCIENVYNHCWCIHVSKNLYIERECFENF